MADFKGKNNLKAREMFNKRLYYRNHAYGVQTVEQTRPNVALFPPNTQDFWWNEITFYGRVSANNFLEPHEPYLPYLKPIPTKAGSVNVLNFVSDAFQRFQNDYILNVRAGKLITDDPYLSEMIPVKGYVSIDKAYYDMQKSFYNSFLTHVNNNNIKHKIQNLDDFVSELFTLFESSGGFPYTKSGFIMSRFCDPLISGLGIDILNLPYSEDEAKKKFIDSPNFACYTELAVKHGFVVDKNIPWRLMADINSETMINYARAYEPSVNSPLDISNLFFIQTAAKELEVFKTYIFRLYNQFVKDNPINITVTHSSARTTKTREARLFLTENQFNDEYKDSYWIEYFIKARNIETGLDYSVPALTKITEVAKDIIKTLDTRSAMSYIKKKFSGVTFYEGSLAYANEKGRQRILSEGENKTKENITSQAKKTRKVFF